MKLTPRNFNNELDTYLNEVMTLTPRALTDKLDDYLAAVCTDSYALQHTYQAMFQKTSEYQTTQRHLN